MSNVFPRISAETGRSSAPFVSRRNSSLLASLVNGAEGRQSERRQSRQSVADLEREFLRPSLRPSTGQDSTLEDEKPKLSKDELEQMLENCMKLTQDKQITEGRLWGLALPQHMPDLVKHNTDHTNFNFQKVIFGLDAAVQIYSKRVDSMHTSALDTRCRLTTEKASKGNSNGEDGEVTVRRRPRRQSQFEGDTTLATSIDQITTKSNSEDALPINPLFHKTSALFDAGGFKGLPTLNLGLSYGGRYVLDTHEHPNQVDGQSDYYISPNHEIDLEVFGTRFETFNERKPISESSQKLYAFIGRQEQLDSTRDLILRGMNSVTLQPQDASVPAPETDPSHLELPLEQDFDMELDGDAEIHLDEEPIDTGFTNNEIRFSFEVADALNLPHAPDEVELLDEVTIGWLLDARHDQGVTRGKAWTGASHWKYPKVAKSSNDDEKDTLPRKKTVKRELDFTQLPETDLYLFKKPLKQSSNSLLFKEDADTLLPVDHKYEASFFLKLSLFPGLHPRSWLCKGQSRTQNSTFFHHGMPGNDFEELDPLDFEENDDFGMIEAPPLIEEEKFDVEWMPIKINMKQLKSDFWSKIKSMSKTQDEVSFQSFAGEVISNYEISFGLCFACSLHLAAEHQFHIVGKTPDQTSIFIPNNVQERHQINSTQ